MKKKQIIIISAIAVLVLALIITLICVFGGKNDKKDEEGLPMPSFFGKTVYHSIGDDGTAELFLYNFDDNELRNISDELEGVSDCRNARFDLTGGKIVFSALSASDSVRRIYLYELSAKKLTCLCPTMMENQSTPDFSPDGSTVVFAAQNEQSTAIMTVNLKSLRINTVVSDSSINTTPSYSQDGAYIYYTSGEADTCTFIKRVASAGGQAESYYSEEAISCKKPVEFGGMLYFTKWFNALNTTDIAARYSAQTKAVRKISFNSYQFDCSDICPITETYAIASSKQSEETGSDLYIIDVYGNGYWSLSELNKKINTTGDELSADYYIVDYSVYAPVTSDIKMNVPDSDDGQLKVNKPAAFTIDISDGYKDYTYSYYVLKDGKIHLSVPYVTTTLITFTPTEPGNYVLKVYVEDKNGSKTVSSYEFTVGAEDIVSVA